jgi:hypothetical protein
MEWFVRFQYKEVLVLPSYNPNLDEAEAVVIVDGLRGGVRPVHPVEGEGLGREVGLTRVQDTAGQRRRVHAHHALHRKKRFTSFPSPAGMPLTKLPLGRNNSVMTSLFPPRESLVVEFLNHCHV